MTRTQPTTWPDRDALIAAVAEAWAKIGSGQPTVEETLERRKVLAKRFIISGEAETIVDAILRHKDWNALLPPPAVMKAPETEGDAEVCEFAPGCGCAGATCFYDSKLRSLPPAVPAPYKLTTEELAIMDQYAPDTAPAVPKLKRPPECGDPDCLMEGCQYKPCRLDQAPPAVPTDAELEEIEKRQQSRRTAIASIKTDDKMYAYAAPVAMEEAEADILTLLRRLKAPAVTMPGREELIAALRSCDEPRVGSPEALADPLRAQRHDASRYDAAARRADAILALWNGRV